MKLMFASDIHGILSGCENTLSAYAREKADRLILLGDLLYHGPRNGVPEGYDPVKVIDLLNGIKEHILCVRGNCEAEVDQMVLEFPVLADYAMVMTENRTFYCTHGHLFTRDKLPTMGKDDILIHGHTHLLTMEELDGRPILNPGSVSLPKGGNPPTYMVYENGAFTIKMMDGTPVQSVTL